MPLGGPERDFAMAFVTVVVQSEIGGTLRDVFVANGETAPVGAPLARIEP